ncbi:hypothetical protein NA57DRAFT_29944 [Rhizodiscina lignyota]|uniref:DUF8004 domain-containing protein n=1 Tax=Rhizodiscina lignyota TaxID=1504668 RepID=A0A9P4MEC3_9PEZI|nr:hypothetical protein NA57DRAFT_29944 [Rhizodiscina lignyota]
MKKKSSGRLSSLFSLGEKDHKNGAGPPVPPKSTGNHLSPNALPVQSNKLSKSSHERAPSEHLLPAPAYPPPAPAATLRKPVPHASTDNLSLAPPPITTTLLPRHASTGTPVSSRPGSAIGSRPTTPLTPGGSPTSSLAPNTPLSANKVKRRSWLTGGGHSRTSSKAEGHSPKAWILGHQPQEPYELTPLLSAQPVSELWNDDGNAFVYLFPRTSGKGPSFRVDSYIFGASNVLRDFANGHNAAVLAHRSASDPRKASVSSFSTPPATPEIRAHNSDGAASPVSRVASGSFEDPDEPIHLYVPLALSTDGAILDQGSEPRFSTEDVDHLMAVRNTFAFLVGQSLIATERRPNTFSIFMQISETLKHFGFSNLDGSTFGEVASLSFDRYVEELQLADVRASREKTIEAIVLGERMRSVMLYNEGFVHGVGKYDEIMNLKSPKFDLISPITTNRMERAAMDLHIRRQNIELRLQEFDFPAIFSGIMNSKTDDARKMVNFDIWRNSFNATKRFFVNYYKHKYGSWPPKASSKKNNFETSGLNRIVLRDLYHDLSSVYDMLVDRTSLTTRGLDGMSVEAAPNETEPHPHILRRILDEYDRSTPPVQPPVPYDVPLFPSLAMIRKDYGKNAANDAKLRGKKLKEEELKALLRSSVNQDSNLSTPFLDAFKDFEHKSLHGKTVVEFADIRCGEWIFLYAVLQTLPMLVIDAPGIKWTRRVEYFLCEPPRSGVPWAREDRALQRNWYGIAGGGHGIEGIYRRSHCWERAEKWSAESGVVSGAVTESLLGDPLPAPPGNLLSPTSGSRPGTPGSRSNRNSVVNLGLEALPIPQGVAPPSPSIRAQVEVDRSKTFDAILGSEPTPATKSKKK